MQAVQVGQLLRRKTPVEDVLHGLKGGLQRSLKLPALFRAEQQPAPVVLRTELHPHIALLPQPLDQVGNGGLGAP